MVHETHEEELTYAIRKYGEALEKYRDLLSEAHFVFDGGGDYSNPVFRKLVHSTQLVKKWKTRIANLIVYGDPAHRALMEEYAADRSNENLLHRLQASNLLILSDWESRHTYLDLKY